MAALCRDCLEDVADGKTRCPACGSRRILAHPELSQLSIAHVDCDAFYASIEKRDNRALEGKPVIVGGGRRGVVSTACYVARTFGVKSAMPMFQALKLCPGAIVIRGNMAKYAEVSHAIRAMMENLTPLVEPLSLDEAYLDLSGTERLHGRSPGKSLAWLARNVEKEVGITISIGLSFNKFLAKFASDLDKPRGFAIIGRKEAKTFLRDKPISSVRGVGPALHAKLSKDGLTTIGQLQDMDARQLAKRYGDTGLWLHRLAHAEDTRHVETHGESKSVSSETTFENNVSSLKELEAILWAQSERVAARAKAEHIGGRTITLKLKTAKFKIRTRSISLEGPTQLSDVIFRVSRRLLAPEADGTPFRLLGVGISQLRPENECDQFDLMSELADPGAKRRASAERAVDKVREKFGKAAVKKGRSLR